MLKPRFSQLWYRVETLRPRLRSHLEIRRHRYRGELWYLVLDTTSGRVHRFSANAYAAIGLMDGSRTVQEIWDLASLRLADFAPTQDETITLLGQLHGADLLQCDVPPDAAEIFTRSRDQARSEKMQSLLNPLAIRIPLCDPDRLLSRLAPLARPLFGVWGLLLWLAIAGTALVFAAQHWSELSESVLDRVMSPQNLLLVWLLFPFIKLFHELGHGLSAKVWGGEVHDLGIMLLVFTPVPYIDVTSSAAFEKPRRRMTVAAAGMLFELVLAAAALAVWINVEPGLLRNCAYNVMLVAGISTLLFNSNPLIRYDGYYILSDLLELPNLAQRARGYLIYLLQRYGFGLDLPDSPAGTWQERFWFLVYSPASWLYRLVIVGGIGMLLAKKFLVLGLVVTAWSAISMLILPLFRGLRYLSGDPRLSRHRLRAWSVSLAGIAALAALLYLPVPLRTQVEGVVWLPEDSFVRAGTDGLVRTMLARSGSRVTREQGLVLNEEPSLGAEERVIRGRIEELSAQHRALRHDDLVQAQILTEQLGHEQARLARIRERRRELVLRGKATGTLVVPQEEDLPGKYLKQGEAIAYIFPDSKVIVRAVVPQEQVSLVRRETRRVEARLARDLSRVHRVKLLREVPEGSEHLPSKTLSPEGGGSTVVDPRERSGTKTFSRTFQYDLELPLYWSSVAVGDRVYLRFDHGWQPLGQRCWRTVRQLLLSRLDV